VLVVKIELEIARATTLKGWRLSSGAAISQATLARQGECREAVDGVGSAAFWPDPRSDAQGRRNRCRAASH
jgi:hypothetical protein